MDKYELMTIPLAASAGIAVAEGHYIAAGILFVFSLAVFIWRAIDRAT